MDSKDAEMIGILILTLIAGYDLIQFQKADTLFEMIRWGINYLGILILLSGASIRSKL